jgi:hypothetical protein
MPEPCQRLGGRAVARILAADHRVILVAEWRAVFGRAGPERVAPRRVSTVLVEHPVGRAPEVPTVAREQFVQRVSVGACVDVHSGHGVILSFPGNDLPFRNERSVSDRKPFDALWDKERRKLEYDALYRNIPKAQPLPRESRFREALRAFLRLLTGR